MPSSRPRSVDVAIIALIVAGHVVLGWLISREMFVRVDTHDTQRSVIVFIPLPALTTTPVPAQITEPRQKEKPRLGASQAINTAEVAGATSSEARISDTQDLDVGLTNASPPTPITSTTPDWHGDAEAAAQRIAQSLATKPGQRPLDGSDRVTSKQKTPTKSFEWSAEPKRAGFSGGLPYVRLGKRCVLVLAFIGCAIGDLPKANGDLFKHMHEDEPPLTSELPGVPGIENPGAGKE